MAFLALAAARRSSRVISAAAADWLGPASPSFSDSDSEPDSDSSTSSSDDDEEAGSSAGSYNIKPETLNVAWAYQGRSAGSHILAINQLDSHVYPRVGHHD